MTCGGSTNALLSQRNQLLKQNLSNDQIFIWNVRLSELGGQIAEHRHEFVETKPNQTSGLYQKLAGKKSKITCAYETNLNPGAYGSTMLKALEDRVEIDKERGFTTVGPHRDDLALQFWPSFAAAASRGETRTMLLALKLLEVASVEKARGTKPILLLDDVFSELDGSPPPSPDRTPKRPPNFYNHHRRRHSSPTFPKQLHRHPTITIRLTLLEELHHHHTLLVHRRC